MRSIKSLTMDIQKDFTDQIVIKQSDALSRYLDITLVDDGKTIDLTGNTVKMYAKKPDNTMCYNNATILDATKGKIEVELTSQMLAITGTLRLELAVLGTNQSILTGRVFSVSVIQSIRDDSAIQSSNEFTALTQGLADVLTVKSTLDSHTEDLLDKQDQITVANNSIDDKAVSVFYPDVVYSFSLFTTDTTRYAPSLDNLYAYGARKIVICPYSISNATTTEFTSNNVYPNLTVSQIRDIITTAQSKGFTVVGLKFHDFLANRNPANFDTWFANYQTLQLQYADLAVEKGIPNFCISCELSNVTPLGKASWAGLIKQVKQKGLTTYIAMNGYEQDANTPSFLQYLDIIGLNMYPALSSNGVNATVEECRYNLYNSVAYTLIAKFKPYNKPLWITETGCSAHVNALQYPWDWNTANIGVGTDDRIQMLYYDTILPFFGQMTYEGKPMLDRICLWDFSTTTNMYTFIGNSLAEKTVKKYESIYAKAETGISAPSSATQYKNELKRPVFYGGNGTVYDDAKTDNTTLVKSTKVEDTVYLKSAVSGLANGTIEGITATNLLGTGGSITTTFNKVQNASLSSRSFDLITNTIPTGPLETKYTLFLNIITNTVPSYNYIQYSITDIYNQTYSGELVVGGYTGLCKFILSSTCTINKISIYLNSEDFDANKVFSFNNVMLVRGKFDDIDLDYFSSHQKTQNVTVTFKNKNLLTATPADYQLKDINYLTGVESVSDNYISSAIFTKIKPSTQYSFTVGSSDGNNVYMYIYWYDASFNFISCNQGAKGGAPATSPSNAYYCKVRYKPTGTAFTTKVYDTNYVIADNLQLCETVSRFVYEPKKSCGVTINKPINRLNSYVFDSYSLSTMTFTKRVGELVFDGSADEWTGDAGAPSQNSTLHIQSVVYPELLAVAKSYPPRTSLFEGDNPDPLWNNDREGIAITNSGRVQMRISKSRLASTNLDGIKTWLASNPLTVYYELATPVVERILPTGVMEVYNTPMYITQSYSGVNSVVKLNLPESIKAVASASNSAINGQAGNSAMGYFNAKFPPPPMVGIKLDGTTDDTTALQNILNTIPDGSAVEIPKGIMVINGDISTNKRIVIKGVIDTNGDYSNLKASTGTIIRAGNTSNNPVFNFNFASNADWKSVALENLHFIGSTSNTNFTNDAQRVAVKLSNAIATNSFKNVYFAGFKRGAIEMDRAYDGVMDNVRIMFCGTDGVYPGIKWSTTTGDYTNNWKINALHMENNTYNMLFSSAHSFQFTNCKLEIGNWVHQANPQIVFDASFNISFTNCYFLNNDSEEDVQGGLFSNIVNVPHYFKFQNSCSKITFDNCKMLTHNDKGAKWFNTDTSCTDIHIANSHLHCCSADYSVQLGKRWKFNNNNVRLINNVLNSSYKVLFQVLSDNSQTMGNTIYGLTSDTTPTSGCLYRVSGNNNSFKDNNVNDCKFNVLAIGDSASGLGNNTVEDDNKLKILDNTIQPNVCGKRSLFASAGSATSITNFIGGTKAQVLFIRATNGNTTLVHNSGTEGRILIKGSANKTLANGDTIQFMFDGLDWFEC